MRGGGCRRRRRGAPRGAPARGPGAQPDGRGAARRRGPAVLARRRRRRPGALAARARGARGGAAGGAGRPGRAGRLRVGWGAGRGSAAAAGPGGPPSFLATGLAVGPSLVTTPHDLSALDSFGVKLWRQAPWHARHGLPSYSLDDDWNEIIEMWEGGEGSLLATGA